MIHKDLKSLKEYTLSNNPPSFPTLSVFVCLCLLFPVRLSSVTMKKKKHLSQGDFPYLNSTGGSPSSPSYPTPQPHAGGQEPW